MSEIHYLIGDATNPSPQFYPVVIAHIVNDVGVMGAGFAKALAQRYPLVKNQYKAWRAGRTPLGKRFDLGMTQIVKINPNVWVANMLAQRGLRGPTNPVPLRLYSLDSCLDALSKSAEGRLVVMPRIGAGRAGGRWHDIEPLIKDNLVDQGYEVHVYSPA